MHSGQSPKSQSKAKTLEYQRRVITDNGRPTVEVRRLRSDHRTPLERLRGTVVDYASPTEPVGTGDREHLD